VGRRRVEFPSDDPRSKFDQAVVNFDQLEQSKDSFKDCAVGYVTLGTTRGDAGADGFVKVDYEYTMAVAKIAKEAGCQQLHYLSSQGAHKDSRFLYPQTKGKVEHEMSQLGFDQLFIYRPAMLLRGDKQRGIEKFGYYLMKPITAFKPGWNQIKVEDVGKSLIVKSSEFGKGSKSETLTNDQMNQLAQTLAD